MTGFFTSRNVIRNLYGQTLLENFLLSAVTTVLLIRIYLELTGYPQIGGANLHIAHMLYGGIMMLIALFILFAFLNRTAIYLASVVGGIGFGFFIDELGKFLTHDNNYFFQPTFALIYCVFILLYLASEAVPKVKKISEREYLVNALDLMKEIIIQDLDTNEKKQVLSYLRKSKNHDPIALELEEIVKSYKSTPPAGDIVTWLKRMGLTIAGNVTENRMFYVAIVSFIIVKSLLALLFTFIIIAALNKYLFFIASGIVLLLLLYFLIKTKSLLTLIIALGTGIFIGWLMYVSQGEKAVIDLDFAGIGLVTSAAISSSIAFLGLLQFRSSYIASLRLFRLSTFISLFLTQFFLFYSFQLLAVIGLFIDLLTLMTLEFVIAQKELDHVQVKSKE